MCSDPGQNAVIKAIKDNQLDSVVVSCCSPNLHEKTFRDNAKLRRHQRLHLRDRQHPRAVRLGAQGSRRGDRKGHQDFAQRRAPGAAATSRWSRSPCR